MKPHEQTWMVIPAQFGPWHVIQNGNAVATVGDGCSNRDTADLVAAAPEMARLLRNLGCDYISPGPHHRSWLTCHECESEVVREDGGGHMDDCALVAVLRKAGVLP